MIDFRKIIAGMPLIALAGACATIGVLASTLFRPEAMLDRGVEAALAQAPTGRVTAPAAPSRRQAIADSPDFWLSRLDDQLPSGLSKAVHVGDRIEISGHGGQKTLEVVDIREIPPTSTQGGDSAEPRFLLVSCRTVGNQGQRLVRFIIEADDPLPAGIGELHRTL